MNVGVRYSGEEPENAHKVLDKPNIGLLSNEFLEDVRQIPMHNLAVELLEKWLKDDIKSKTRNNVVQEKKYADRLEETLLK